MEVSKSELRIAEIHGGGPWLAQYSPEPEVRDKPDNAEAGRRRPRRSRAKPASWRRSRGNMVDIGPRTDISGALK